MESVCVERFAEFHDVHNSADPVLDQTGGLVR